MIPSKEQLAPYVNDRKGAAKQFNVSEKTVIRWLKSYELYIPRANYGCNKLDLDKAREIRRLHREGVPMKDLAKQFNVTFSAVSRVVHNVTYHEEKELAQVSVIYNPETKPVAFIAKASDQ